MNNNTKQSKSHLLEFVEEVRERVQNSTAFKYWQEEYGLSIDNFEIIDIKNGRLYQVGNQDIGKYSIFIKDNNIDSVFYDLEVVIKEIEENERAILGGTINQKGELVK
jgi:ABC-type Zn uptake system ZnuABC Zn-binding protein ZnuA